MDFADELKESLGDSDSSGDWTERGIEYLLETRKHCSDDVMMIDGVIDGTKRRIALFTLMSMLFSMFGTSGLLVNYVQSIIEIVSPNPGSMSYRIGIESVICVVNVITTMLMSYLKVKAYEQQLQTAFECSQGYFALEQDIDKEIYQKHRNRAPMNEVFKKIALALGKLQKKMLTLNLKGTVLINA